MVQICTLNIWQIHNILCISKGCYEIITFQVICWWIFQSKSEPEEVGETVDSGEYNVYSTFQSHEPDFDYLKSLEIEEKINKIRWLPQQNAARFLLSTNGEIPDTQQTLVVILSVILFIGR